MSTEGKGGGQGMEPGDDEALWRLLGRARPPEASPYFSRRVLREVALAEENGRGARVSSRGVLGGWLLGLRRTLRGPRGAVWSGAAVVAIFWLSVVLTTNKPAPAHAPPVAPVETLAATQAAVPDAAAVTTAQADTAPAPAVEEVASQDVEVIADLDNEMAHEENRLWTEDTARF